MPRVRNFRAGLLRGSTSVKEEKDLQKAVLDKSLKTRAIYKILKQRNDGKNTEEV
jgi:hypothetical protein